MLFNFRSCTKLFRQPKYIHFCQILIAMLLLVAYIVSPLTRPDSFEFGGYLEAGYRINAGQTIYRDWHFMYGPVVAYWASLVVKTGLSLPVLHRLYFLPDAIGTSLALYVCMRRLRLNLLSCALLLVGTTSFFAIGSRWCGVILALILFSYSIVHQKKVCGYLSGIVVGLQVLYFQDIAVYTGAALIFLFIALLLTKRYEPLQLIGFGMAVIAGFASIALCLFAFLVTISALPDYIDRAWVFTAKYYDSFDFDDPPGFFSVVDAQSSGKYDRFLLPLLIRWISGTLTFYILPIVGALGFGVYFSKVRRSESISTDLLLKLGLSVIAVMLFRIVFKTGDTIKLAVNLFPAVVLSLVLLQDTFNTRLRVITALIASTVVSMTFYPYVKTLVKDRDGISHVETVKRTKVTSDRDNVVDFLRNKTSKKIQFACLPNDTLLYIDLNQINPLSFDYFDPIVSPKYDAALAVDISEHAPYYIVVDSSVQFWNQWRFGENFGSLSYAMLRKKYRVLTTFGNYQIWEISK
jgi:hypothetical protein